MRKEAFAHQWMCGGGVWWPILPEAGCMHREHDATCGHEGGPLGALKDGPSANTSATSFCPSFFFALKLGAGHARRKTNKIMEV